MSDSMLLIDIGQSAGTLPNTTPAPVRYGSWFPVAHSAAPMTAVEDGTATPVADGVLIEWTPSALADVEYRIERAPSANGPWMLVAYTTEPRYLVSDPSGATWYYRITPLVRGKAGATVIVEGAAKQAPSVADLVAQQTALDAEILARTQGDAQTALAAAADAKSKADAALAQALAAADAALANATAQTDALAAEVAEIVNAPAWEPATAYLSGWLVRHAGGLYRAGTDTTGQAPDQFPAVWEYLGQYSSVAGVAAAALTKATTNASAISAQATRIDGLIVRMPSGTGKVASEASVTAEQQARASGDAANASALQSVQATLDALPGMNLLPDAYSTAAAADLPPVTQVHGTLTRDTATTWLGLGSFRMVSSAADEYHVFTGERVTLQGGKKYIVSLYVNASITGCVMQCYLKSATTWHPVDMNAAGAAGTWTRVSGILDLANDPATRYQWRLDNHHSPAGVTTHVDAVMIEEQVGSNTVPSTYVRGVSAGMGVAALAATKTNAVAISSTQATVQQQGSQISAQAGQLSALTARAPAGTGMLAAEAALISEQQVRAQGDSSNASAISAQATRIDGLIVRMPSGTGKVASEASVTAEQQARASGDAANASALQSVQAGLAGKADASVVQLMQTKVAGLEGEGHNSNLLTNASLNSGTNGWIRTQTSGSNWSAPAVNLLGDAWHPPGINNIAISHTGAVPSGEYAVLRSPNAAITPGQRYIASCYLANHMCNARLIVMWFDAAGAFLFSSLGDIQIATTASKTLSQWPRRSMVLTAPAGAAYVAVCGMFIGTGQSTYAYGWMLRPMLEHARAVQTEPSPWNAGGMETSAEYSLVLQANNMIGGLRMHNNGAVMDATFLATIFRVLSPAGAPNGLELQNGTLRVWRGNAQRIIGNGFGPNGDLMDYFGPNVGVSNASKSNATMWMDIHGNAYWGGEISAGPLTFTTQTASTQTVGLELINGPFQTNGNLRTVTITFSRHSIYTKHAHGGGISLGAGSNTATIKIYRKIGTGAEVLWQTITATGPAEVKNEYDGPSSAWLSWKGSLTATDISPSTDTVRYRAHITAFDARGLNGTFNTVQHTQSLKITSKEGA